MRREFMYRVVIRRTGEIIESESLKSLYHALRLTLRCELGDVAKMKAYDNCSATIEYGILETYGPDQEGYMHSDWYSLRVIGTMFVGMTLEAFTRDSDNHEICYDRRVY